MIGHALIIRKYQPRWGLTRAACSCGKWALSRPYRMTKGEIVEWHEKHVASLWKPPKIQTGLSEKGRTYLEEEGQLNCTKGGK